MERLELFIDYNDAAEVDVGVVDVFLDGWMVDF